MDPKKLRSLARNADIDPPRAKFGPVKDEAVEDAEPDKRTDEERAAAVAARLSLGERDNEDLEDLLEEEAPTEKVRPDWARDGKLWDRALKAVQPNWKDYEDPGAVVAYAYVDMGGRLK